MWRSEDSSSDGALRQLAEGFELEYSRTAPAESAAVTFAHPADDFTRAASIS